VGSESLGEEAAVEEVTQAEERQIGLTKMAAVVAVSSRHGQASQTTAASAISERPPSQGHDTDRLAGGSNQKEVT
jgi:hypothetical protein